MPNKRKRAQPQKWGLQADSCSQDKESQGQEGVEDLAAGTYSKRACRRPLGVQQAVCKHGCLPIQPFFQLLFVGTQHSQPDAVNAFFASGSDEADEAQLSFKSADPDPHGAQVRPAMCSMTH